ncbi:UNVERIFIED_CONTAM: hypothetical protein RF648_20885, partial [Kocuria sp. CPCC 205274]
MSAVTAAATATAGTASTIPVSALFTFGGGSSAADYNFSVTPAKTGVTVSTAGVVSVAANATAGTANIVATNIATPSITATKVVTINAAPTPTLKTIALAGVPALTGNATAGYTVGGIKADGTDSGVVVTITAATDTGAPLPAASAITVVPTTSGDAAKLEALTVTGTNDRKFT